MKAAIGEAKRSADLTEKTLVTTQRAFVYLESISGDVVGDNIKVTPIWQNSGTTPAKNLKIKIDWVASPSDLQTDYPYAYRSSATRLFLGPRHKLVLARSTFR